MDVTRRSLSEEYNPPFYLKQFQRLANDKFDDFHEDTPVLRTRSTARDIVAGLLAGPV